MKTKWLFLFLSFLFATPAFSQNTDYIKDMENNDLQIRQKPDTEQLLSDFLKSAEIKEDTVYAILYSPTSCLRCEAAIPSFYKELKRNNPTNKMLLITAYPEAEAAEKYNKKKRYQSDYYLYDTHLDYNKIFSFNIGQMNGLYVLKIYPKEGIMVTGGAFRLLKKEFVDQLVPHNTRLAPHTFPLDIQEESPLQKPETEENILPYPWKTNDTPIELKGDVFISGVYDIPKIENGYLFFNDMLNNGILFFKQENGRYVYQTLFQAVEEEKNLFVNIPEDKFKKAVEFGQVFYIPLSTNMTDDNQLAISYSLPKILGEQLEDTYAISYYNAAVILTRNLDNFQPGKMIIPDLDLEHSKYFHMHFTFDLFNNKLWIGCQKLTWPLDGFVKEDISGKVDLDVFDDKFYSTFNPIIASFDTNTGKNEGYYGHLEESLHKSKTGYFFLNNIYTHYGKDFLYANGYTGKLYVADSSDVANPDRCYTAFDIDVAAIPEPDSTKFYDRECLSAYAPYFKKCITAVKMNDKEISCLIRLGKSPTGDINNERHSFVVIDRKSGKSEEYLLPPLPESVKCLGYGIRNEQNHFNPFIFIKDESGYKIKNLMR